MSKSVDPDETAQNEPSHLDLCCLQKLLLSPVALKELKSSPLGGMQLPLKQINFRCSGILNSYCICQL